MIHGLDTSVLMRILTRQPTRLATNVIVKIHRLQLAGDRFFISDLVLSEAYFALQDHYGISKANAIAALNALCNVPGFEVTPHAKEALSTPDLERAHPGFADRLICGDYLNRGLKTFACEKSFSRMPLTEVIKESDRLGA